jgi:hypothetical protein
MATDGIQIRRPPRAVAISVAIHATSQALGFAYYAAIGKFPHSIAAGAAWLAAFCVLFFYLRAIYLGYNWVRWLSVALAVSSLGFLPWFLPTLDTQATKVVTLIQQAVDTTAAALLFLPSSRPWYRSNYSSGRTPKPLHGSGAD